MDSPSDVLKEGKSSSSDLFGTDDGDPDVSRAEQPGRSADTASDCSSSTVTTYPSDTSRSVCHSTDTSPLVAPAFRRKRPKNSRHRRIGPVRKKHKSSQVLETILEEEDRNIEASTVERDVNNVLDVPSGLDADTTSDNVSSPGKKQNRKRKSKQLNATRKYQRREKKKNDLSGATPTDDVSLLNRSEPVIDAPDGDDHDEYEHIHNSPNLHDEQIQSSPDVLMSDFESKTEALRTLSQNLHELLDESDWNVDLQNDMCRLVLLSDSSNVAVQRSIVWNSSSTEEEDRLQIFIHNKPLPMTCFLWDIEKPDHNNIKSIAHFLSKLANLLETVHVCIGVLSYENYWDFAAENGLGEIEDSFYGGSSSCFRSLHCTLVEMERKVCTSCANQKMRFKRKKWRITNARGKDAKKINNRYLPKKSLLAKTEIVAASNRNLIKTVSKLRNRIKKLIRKNDVFIDDNISQDFMKTLRSNLEFMTPIQKMFWNEQVKAISKQNIPKGVRWSPMMIKIALHLQMLSPTAYNYLRDTGVLQLPSTRRLYDFSHFGQTMEGIQEHLIDSVKENLDKLSLSEHEKYCNLLFDEMSIHSDLVITKTGVVFGFTSQTNVEQAIADLENDFKNIEGKRELAKKALVYMLQGTSANIHQVVGIYTTTDLSAQQLFTRTWDVVYNLESRGIAVLCLICDGASCNKRFFKMHEKWDQNNDFVYATENLASGEDRPIFFIIDPPHLLKTLRNSLANSNAHKHSRNMWKSGESLSWQAIEKLHSATLTDKFKKHKLTSSHVKLTAFSKMNVRLASQTMSDSVANSLCDYRDDPFFEGTVTESLIKFLRVVNKFFDCLNGSNDPDGRRNQSNKFLLPYTSCTDERFKILKEEILGFFEDWKQDVKSREGTYSDDQREKMMISWQSFESLQITVYGFCGAVRYLLSNGVTSVDAKAFNQDKLEQYFGIMRMSGGASNNPTFYRLTQQCQAHNAAQAAALPPKKGNTRASIAPLPVNQEPLPSRKNKKKIKS